jgi:hypothetical protein
VETGIDTIKGQAWTATIGSHQLGSWNASVLFGKGVLTVEEIRLVKGVVIEQ